MAKPFLKWVGGKTQLLSQIQQHIPDKFGDYYEPFLGGGAVFFALNIKKPRKAYLNDLNPHLIDSYRDVRDNLEELFEELDKLQAQYVDLDHDDKRELYYLNRKEYNRLKEYSSVKKSALLIFLNKTGFNGMYRENPRGEFNIPHGRNGLKRLYDRDQLIESSKALKSAVFTAYPYDVAIAKAKKGDFIYLDPPYWPITKTSNFTSYIGQDFVEEEQYILKKNIDDLGKRGCKVMLSNSNKDAVKKLYKEYNIYEVKANRFVNCKQSGRGKIAELVITNY